VPITESSTDPAIPAVMADNNAGPTVTGNATTGGRGVQGSSASGIGVLGQSDAGDAVYGNSRAGIGVLGHSDTNVGVLGESNTADAVHGNSHSTNAAGVSGFNISTSAPSGPGVLGHSSFGAGVVGDSDHFDGVFGVSHNLAAAGVSGHNPGGLAGFFDGNVTVTGDIFLPGADCAEQFDIAEAEQIDPGTVVVFDQEGALRPSQQAYDKKVAGVVSGAGGYRPGIVLDRQQSQVGRASVALVGKVYCKVDAQYASIAVGDLLTTSATTGHAMKANDPFRIYGSVIGKALRPLVEGQGLIPILIALQ
jgi:hypothetical protein